MLWTIFQGSKPMAASTTPTRIDSRISRNATISGEPPRKRVRPSLVAGNSRVSLGIDGLPRGFALIVLRRGAHGEPVSRRQTLPKLYLLRPPLASAPAFPAGRPRAAACPSAAG